MLKASGVHPLVRQGVAAGMAEHVHMNRKRNVGGFASPLNEPGNAHPLERVATLVYEHIGALARQPAQAS